MNTSAQTYISSLPAYISEKLNLRLENWIAKGWDKKDLKSRIERSLEVEAKHAGAGVAGAIEHMGNYGWMDRYLGVENKGLFINEEFKKSLSEEAVKTIKTWLAVIL
jgi:hypothetical protein